MYGITENPYLVFATNAFALLGLRALYFVIEGALGSLAHLGYGLATILVFIGVKLVLDWAHTVWPRVPEIGLDPVWSPGTGRSDQHRCCCAKFRTMSRWDSDRCGCRELPA